jgi:sensor domain CHASE-containing protein
MTAKSRVALILLCLALAIVFGWWALQAAWLSSFQGADLAALKQRFYLRAAIAAIFLFAPIFLWRIGRPKRVFT